MEDGSRHARRYKLSKWRDKRGGGASLNSAHKSSLRAFLGTPSRASKRAGEIASQKINEIANEKPSATRLKEGEASYLNGEVPPASPSCYTLTELKSLGINLPKKPEGIHVSRLAVFYNAHLVTLKNHVRIDAFALLSGRIFIDSYTHIGAFVALYGSSYKGGGIKIGRYCTISSRASIYSSSDNFDGDALISPFGGDFASVNVAKIIVFPYVGICSAATILPPKNARFLACRKGSVLGACSLLKSSMGGFGIYAGVPARFCKARKRELLKLRRELEGK